MRTSRSIIEQHRALDDDVLTGLEAARYDGLIALLEIDLDGARLERPWCDLDKHLIGFVSQHHCCRWDGHYRLLRGHKCGAGEHVRFQSDSRIRERYSDFGPTRVRIENVANEKDP